MTGFLLKLLHQPAGIVSFSKHRSRATIQEVTTSENIFAAQLDFIRVLSLF